MFVGGRARGNIRGVPAHVGLTSEPCDVKQVQAAGWGDVMMHASDFYQYCEQSIRREMSDVPEPCM